jgi:hypothetical protein
LRVSVWEIYRKFLLIFLEKSSKEWFAAHLPKTSIGSPEIGSGRWPMEDRVSWVLRVRRVFPLRFISVSRRSSLCVSLSLTQSLSFTFSISLSVLFPFACLRNERKRIRTKEERKEKRRGKNREGRKFTYGLGPNCLDICLSRQFGPNCL